MYHLFGGFRLPPRTRVVLATALLAFVFLAMRAYQTNGTSTDFAVIASGRSFRALDHMSYRPEIAVITHPEDIEDVLRGIGMPVSQADGTASPVAIQLHHLHYVADSSFVVILTAGVGANAITTRHVRVGTNRISIQADVDTVPWGGSQTGDIREPFQIIHVTYRPTQSNQWYDVELQTNEWFGYETKAMINRHIP